MFLKRDNICRDAWGHDYHCYSKPWNDWGRWVVFGICVLIAIACFLIFARTSARRRLQANKQPYYATGWTVPGQQPQPPPSQPYYTDPDAPPPPYPYPYATQPPYGAAPPPDQQPPMNSYYAPNSPGYHQPGHPNEYELQQPQNAYAPPPGPPPSKIHDTYK